MGYVLAVDGGNTKTVAVVADTDGRVLGTGLSGCSDIYGAVSPDAGFSELTRAVSDALTVAGLEPAEISASTFGLAGADWPEDIRYLEQRIGEQFGFDSALVVNDALTGLRCGSPNWQGVAVICGTFNAIGARNANGRVFHIGFWPDRTGAYDMSTEALKAVYRDELCLGPPTLLTSRALQLFGATDALDLMHRFTRRERPLGREQLVRMAPVLLDAAEAGDAVASAIVTSAGHVLGAEAVAAARRVGLDLEGTLIVISGGLFRHPTALLADAVMSRIPGAAMVRPTSPPVVGGLLVAFDQLSVELDPDELGRQLTPAPA